MSEIQVLSVILGFLSVILIPCLILLVRIVSKWTRTEVKLEELGKDLRELVENKDKVHAEMLAQMREDRTATDKRLRWLETNLWHKAKKLWPSGTRSGTWHFLSESLAISLPPLSWAFRH